MFLLFKYILRVHNSQLVNEHEPTVFIRELQILIRGRLRERDALNTKKCARVNQRHFGGKTWSPSFSRTGSLSIDDSDSSKNVTFKIYSRFSKTCRVYSNSLRMQNVGGFSLEVDFLGTALKFRKRKKNSSSLVYVLHTT